MQSHTKPSTEEHSVTICRILLKKQTTMKVHNQKTYRTTVMTSFKQIFGKNKNNVISFLLSRSFVWNFIIFGRKVLKLFTSKHTYRMHRKGPLTWTYVQLSGHYVQLSGHCPVIWMHLSSKLNVVSTFFELEHFYLILQMWLTKNYLH